MKPESSRDIKGISDNAPELLDSERAILDMLTEADRDFLRSHYSNNLNRDKRIIAGVRSEDLLFFLECVHKGYIPVGQGGIRTKSKSAEYFFLTPNPELPALSADILANCYEKTFRDIVRANLQDYSIIGIQQGIYRIFKEQMKTPEFVEAITLALDRYMPLPEMFESDLSEEALERNRLETWLKAIALEISDGIDIKLNSHRLPYLYGVSKLVPQEKLHILGPYFKSLKDRGGICVAFKPDIFKKYEPTAEKNIIHSQDEVAIAVPGGKIPIDLVHGFEALGNFEGQVLLRLEI